MVSSAQIELSVVAATEHAGVKARLFMFHFCIEVEMNGYEPFTRRKVGYYRVH